MKILTEKAIVRDSKRKNYVMLLKILMKKCKKRNIIIIIRRKNYINYQMNKLLQMKMKDLDFQKYFFNHLSLEYNGMK